MAKKDISSIAYGYLGPSFITEQLFEVTLMIRAKSVYPGTEVSPREMINNIYERLKCDSSALREIEQVQMPIKLAEDLAYAEALNSFSPKADEAVYFDLTEENIRNWQKIIRLYYQEHHTLAESALFTGEIIGLHYKLQGRRRLEKKD